MKDLGEKVFTALLIIICCSLMVVFVAVVPLLLREIWRAW